jgi:hypothetical protein
MVSLNSRQSSLAILVDAILRDGYRLKVGFGSGFDPLEASVLKGCVGFSM